MKLHMAGIFCAITACMCCMSQNNVFAKDKILVAVSFNAMRECAEAVGKEYIDVKTIIPNGTEPHEFEPKTSDMVLVGKADVFIYNGFGMEAWAEKTIKAAHNPKLIVVNSSQGISPIQNTDPDEIKEHGQNDPHIWLSLKASSRQSANIRDALIKADPSHKAVYEKNCSSFQKKLLALHDEYSKKLKASKHKRFVTGHAAFAYLARDFGLEQNSVEDVFAEGEPSAKKLSALVDYCKQHTIKTIFVEEMVSPKVSETLAKEVGATARKIYTLESREDNKDYLQSMRDNLQMILESLK